MPPQSLYDAIEYNTWGAALWNLGAHFLDSGDTVTFAVYSKHATRVLLEIYNEATGQNAVAEFEMVKNLTDDIWRAKVSGAGPGTLYGFRCWGTNWPFVNAWQRGNAGAGFIADFDNQGNRCNPNKLLFDPYARELSHERLSEAMRIAGENGGMYGTGSTLYKGTQQREVDTGCWALKGVVVSDSTSTGNRPRLPAEDAAIYEAHVRNLTSHPSSSSLRATLSGIADFTNIQDIPPAFRGTFKAAGMMAPYIKALGFTVIELLPVQETINGVETTRAGNLNHWGYMTQGFFAPDRDYSYEKSYGGPTREFKEMVKAFHDEGIEVYLDVVFNHTAEGGNWDGKQDCVGFVSLGGFDTTEYYVLTNNHILVDGATGCSNQLNFSAVAAQALVIDALEYWIDEMGIDGFRFDLAPVLGRTPNAFDRENWDYQRRFFSQHDLLNAIRVLGETKQVEMIAEAWDIWGYEVGNFPSGWGEWNGRFRDTVRQYLKGGGAVDEFMKMVNGDYEHFSDQGGAQKSVNFVTAHDGFTLLDLVSYNVKNNGDSFPFGESDGGTDDNSSWDSGGDYILRRQRMRNFWTILFFSRGVPLAVSGDEFARTQNGNNNPWNLNTIGMWNNYAMAMTNRPTSIAVDPANLTVKYHDNFGFAECAPNTNPFFEFAVFVARLRNQHRALRQRTWGNLTLNDNDVSYVFSAQNGRSGPVWGDRCVRIHIDGSGVGDCDFLLIVNMWTTDISFDVPAQENGKKWVRIIDTAAWGEPYCNYWHTNDADTIESDYLVHPWSIAVLQEIHI